MIVKVEVKEKITSQSLEDAEAITKINFGKIDFAKIHFGKKKFGKNTLGEKTLIPLML